MVQYDDPENVETKSVEDVAACEDAMMHRRSQPRQMSPPISELLINARAYLGDQN